MEAAGAVWAARLSDHGELSVSVVAFLVGGVGLGGGGQLDGGVSDALAPWSGIAVVLRRGD